MAFTANSEGLCALLAAANHVAQGGQGSEALSAHPVGNEGRALAEHNPEADIRTELRALSATFARQMARLSSRLDSLSERVDATESPAGTPDPVAASSIASPAERNPALWCDRSLNEPIPTNPVIWPDEEDGTPEDEPADDAEGCKLHPVTVATGGLLKESFSNAVPNGTRRKWRRVYGMPAADATKCPKLDGTLKTQVPKEGKDGDRTFSRLQTFVLDAVGPLASLLEQHQAGRLTPATAAEAATMALKFLGNASAQISTERRKRLVAHLNPDLKPLVEGQESFKSAAPLLFGKDFAKTAKEHVDSVKSLRKLGAPSGTRGNQQFFRQGRPHSYSQAARGGGAFRGGSRNAARGRFRPYSTGKENRPRSGSGGSNQSRQ